MHLLLASVSAATSPSGVCRHAANIARGMAACPSVRKVTMLIGEWQTQYFRDAFNLSSERLEIRAVSITNSSVSRNLWYLRALSTLARETGADMVHLAFPMPVLRSMYAVPVVVSLHDLYPFDIPKNFGRHRAWLNRSALRLCLRNVDAIACVSEQTRARVHELFPSLEPQRTSVIPNSIYAASDNVQVPLPEAIRGYPFLLCVAQHRANKNLTLLLRSFRIALDSNVLSRETKLVIVGTEGPETGLLQRVVQECDLQARVLFLSGITDALLSTLYSKCELVVAPSMLEGFGLPVAEALAVGCRVACSDIAAFRAVDDLSCIFFNHLDGSEKSLVAALRDALAIPRSMATSTAGLGPQQAAAMYAALYSKLMVRSTMSVFKPSPADLSASGDL